MLLKLKLRRKDLDDLREDTRLLLKTQIQKELQEEMEEGENPFANTLRDYAVLNTIKASSFPKVYNDKQGLIAEAKEFLTYIQKGKHMGLRNDKYLWNDEVLQGDMQNLRCHLGNDPLPMGTLKMASVGDHTFNEKYQGTISLFLGFVRSCWQIHGQGLKPFLDGVKLWIWIYCLVAHGQYQSATIGAHMRQALEILKHMKATYGLSEGDAVIVQHNIENLNVIAGRYENRSGVSKLKVSAMDVPLEVHEPCVDQGWVEMEGGGPCFPGLMEMADLEELLGAGSSEFKSGPGEGESNWPECLAGWVDVDGAALPIAAHNALLDLVEDSLKGAMRAVLGHKGCPISGVTREKVRVATMLCLMYGFFPVIRIGALLAMKVGLCKWGGNCLYIKDGRIHIHVPHSKRNADWLMLSKAERKQKLRELEDEGHIVHFSIPLESWAGKGLSVMLEVLKESGQEFMMVDKKGRHQDSKGFSNDFPTTVDACLMELYGVGAKAEAFQAVLPRSAAQVRRLYGTISMVENQILKKEWQAAKDVERANGKRLRQDPGTHTGRWIGREQIRASMMGTSLKVLRSHYQDYQVEEASEWEAKWENWVSSVRA